MESNSSKAVLPSDQPSPLEGEVCVQYIRCGKLGCRCQSGQRHGPYHYRIWREGAQVHKVYVKSSEVEAVKARCDAHRSLTRSLRDVRQARLKLIQNIQKEWRRTQHVAGK